MATKSTVRTLVVKDPKQRKALTSPIRCEILGQFSHNAPLSVSDIAELMGRPATAIYYHVHRLEEVGLIERVGSRPSVKRGEVLFRPVAEQFDLTPDRRKRDQVQDALTTLGVAHNMTLRDLEAALEEGTGRYEGPDRNCIALRLHGRLSRKSLAKVNRHLDAIIEICQQKPGPRTTDAEFISFTTALLPLRGRRESE